MAILNHKVKFYASGVALSSVSRRSWFGSAKGLTSSADSSRERIRFLATIYDLKPRFQALLRPVANSLAHAGVTANGVTLAALGLSLAHGAWLAIAPQSRLPFLLLPVTLFIRMALNAIDGMMAREHGMASPSGAVLNELSDVVSDAALYLPFALVGGVNTPLVVLVVIAAIIGEMAGALGPMLGESAPL